MNLISTGGGDQELSFPVALQKSRFQKDYVLKYPFYTGKKFINQPTHPPMSMIHASWHRRTKAK